MSADTVTMTAMERRENYVGRMWVWQTSVVQLCGNILRRKIGVLTQGRSTCGRHRRSEGVRSKIKAPVDLLGGHEGHSKVHGFGWE